MKQGNKVELKMKKTLQAEADVDMGVFSCKILRHDSKKERIYLLLESEMLTEISLDALYDCVFKLKDETISCDGRVKERYRNEVGNILEFQIENGFYVDKQEV